jgi:hypothetical protein
LTLDLGKPNISRQPELKRFISVGRREVDRPGQAA